MGETAGFPHEPPSQRRGETADWADAGRAGIGGRGERMATCRPALRSAVERQGLVPQLVFKTSTAS